MELRPSRIVEGEAGVFAAAFIPKGMVLTHDAEDMEHDDYLLSHEEFDTLSPKIQKAIRNYCVERQGGHLVLEGIDFNDLSITWFLNHSCEGNLGLTKEGDFIALRDIEEGEELSYDYGLTESGNFSMDCHCGSPSCRKHISGTDHKDPAFRAKYADYLYPDLR